MDTLQQLPALVVLERFPVPVLAISDDGTILFANSAFADMLGHPAQHVLTLAYSEIFQIAPDRGSPVPSIRARGEHLVELRHADGSTVRAQVSHSALRRDDDRLVLVVFHDLTERLWLEEI
nr:PAS domain-containing protein [Mycobacterium sp. MS1601]